MLQYKDLISPQIALGFQSYDKYIAESFDF